MKRTLTALAATALTVGAFAPAAHAQESLLTQPPEVHPNPGVEQLRNGIEIGLQSRGFDTAYIDYLTLGEAAQIATFLTQDAMGADQQIDALLENAQQRVP
jgi:hypothetical protein